MAVPSPHEPAARRPVRTRWAEIAVTAALCAVVVWLYGWYASPREKLFERFGGKNEYYNLLMRGFERGHLWMDADPDKDLLASPNPYVPSQRRGDYLPDTSLYQKRYYLYFGAAPVLTLYWPFHALTGWYLRDTQAVPLFLSLGFLAGVALLLGLRRRHLTHLGSVPALLGLLAWGTTPLLFMLARRSTFYEVPIASAYAFVVIALLCLFMGERSLRPCLWITLASLAYGLAIASRPTYLFGAAMLLVPMLWSLRQMGFKASTPLRRFVAAVIPVAVVIAGMLLYNFERFGSFLDFGRQYQLTYLDELQLKHFSPWFVPENLYLYLFAPARLGGYFPFFYPIEFSHGPSGYFGIEDTYGLLVNAPFLLLAFASILTFRRNGPKGIALAAAAVVVGVTPILLCFFSSTVRYMVDFAPALALLAVLGFWEAWDCCIGWIKGVFATATFLLLAWSIAFNLLAAIGHVQMLKKDEPELYDAIARAGDTPRHALDLLTGRPYGPLELTLRFPPFTGTRVEPLAISGDADQTDYVYIRYEDPRHVTLAYEHMYVSRVASPPLEIDYAKPHLIRISVGSLYPHAYDKYFDGLSTRERQRRLETVRLEFDGQVVASMLTTPFSPISPMPLIGRSTLQQQAFGERFTGQILGRRVIDVATVPPSPQPHAGAYVLTLIFPSPAIGQNVPILSTGVTGKADVLSAHFADATHVQFRLDRWGEGFFTGPLLAYTPGKRQTVVVSFGSFYPEEARPPTISTRSWDEARHHLHVLLDGETALDIECGFYPADEENTYVGRNPMGASTCGPEFTGQLYRYERTVSGLPFLH